MFIIYSLLLLFSTPECSTVHCYRVLKLLVAGCGYGLPSTHLLSRIFFYFKMLFNFLWHLPFFPSFSPFFFLWLLFLYAVTISLKGFFFFTERRNLNRCLLRILIYFVRLHFALRVYYTLIKDDILANLQLSANNGRS